GARADSRCLHAGGGCARGHLSADGPRANLTHARGAGPRSSAARRVGRQPARRGRHPAGGWAGWILNVMVRFSLRSSMSTLNSFGSRSVLEVDCQDVQYFSLAALERAGFPEVARLPYSLKILLENLLRTEDGRFVKAADVEALARWDVKGSAQKEIAFTPARVLLQDFTGVPAIVDLAAMRDGIARLGGDPGKVNPLQPVELVIDHSVQVDYFGRADAFQLNAELEFSRNRERRSEERRV